ncbi:DNA glycosylase [Durotheca rogersii]|uniref:DNA glycosylase n=1 Tax=Durotheca rogersii TaxID=419775 RepID=UPI00221FEEA2|nr:DNA glycosylase [Durotheca rogersii]KAI5860173.1 DNA glycosylase [Durotheca rogersii]
MPPPRPAPSSPPRRITRASLARFKYGASDDGSSAKENSTPPPHPSASAAATTTAATLCADIEDVIPNASATSRKRKRTALLETTTTTTTTSQPPRRRAVKTEIKAELETDDAASETKAKQAALLASEAPATAAASGGGGSKKRQRKPARKTVDAATGETRVEPPADWETVYALVKAMRGPGGVAADAPVDTMGCERLAEAGASERDRRFQTLVALMLSSQTRDAVNAGAMRRLQGELEAAPGAPRRGLTLANVLAAPAARIDELIRAVGFHNNKARFLKRAAEALRDDWAGDVPDSLAGLLALPGVGPKMAHLCLSAAWGRTEGVGVDVHVHRLTNLWRWHPRGPTPGPEATRRALEAWLPRDRWREINALLVGFGQTVCAPVASARRCGDCELGLRGLCPAADRKKVAEGRRRREREAACGDGGSSGGAAVKTEDGE